jgi:hypothetical protein
LAVIKGIETGADGACCPGKPCYLDQFGRWNVSLGDQQMRDGGIVRRESGIAFRWWKQEAARVLERISGKCRKPSVPHQAWVKGSVDHGRAAALIPWSLSMRSDQLVAVNPNCDGLGVADAVRRRMAARTSIVAVQAACDVEPKQAPEIGEWTIQRAAESLLQRGSDTACKFRFANTVRNRWSNE